MGRGWAFLLVGVVLCGCRADPPPLPRPATSRHVVVLVHGIFGDASHFGRTRDALLRHLVEDGVRHEVLPFEYDTFDARKRIEDFAIDLDGALAHLALRGDDRVSFVAHSQGGLVVLAWMGHAWHGDPGFHPDLLPRVDAFVTLATPFWGSKLATFTRHFEPQATRGQGAPLQPSSAQLTGMTLGSAQVETFRAAGMAVANNGRPAPLAQMRPLAIGGYVEWLKVAAWFSAGEEAFEDDTAVLLPSSRPDFFHLVVDEGALGPDREVAAAAFGHADLAPYRVVNAIHLSPTVDVPQLSPGIAQTPARCLDEVEGCHPAFPLVLAHLLGRPVPDDRGTLVAMTAFMLEVVAEDAHGEPVSDLAVRPVDGPARDDGVAVHIARQWEIYGALTSPLAGRRGVAYYFSGTVTGAGRPHQDPPFAPASVRLEITAAGHAPLRVNCPVRPTESTYLRVILQDGPDGAQKAR